VYLTHLIALPEDTVDRQKPKSRSTNRCPPAAKSQCLPTKLHSSSHPKHCTVFHKQTQIYLAVSRSSLYLYRLVCKQS